MTLDSKSTEVARTTLAFDETEDRIRLTCALDEEQVVILWFTWRLASRLVTHLLSFIPPLPELEDGGPRQRSAEGEGDNINKVADEETAAQAISEPKQLISAEAPVIATGSTPAWVVASIDITNGPMFVRLSFREKAGHTLACLSLEHAQLARWLEGLRHCYIQAGWSMNAWSAPRDTRFGIPSAKNVVLH